MRLFLALLWNLFIGPQFASYTIPSGSMIPTLHPGDAFIATMNPGPGENEETGRIPVERGDVIVFVVPSRGNAPYVKRVVGLAGDRVQMVGGVLVINGTPVRRELLPDDPAMPEGTKVFAEVLPNGRRYETLDLGPGTFLDDSKAFLVPPGRYFVLGDNRDNSIDSRTADFGMVPSQDIIGRAEYVLASKPKGSAARWNYKSLR